MINAGLLRMEPSQGLAAVRALRLLADRLEDIQVVNARNQGWRWQAIADALDVSRQASVRLVDFHSAHPDAEPDDGELDRDRDALRSIGIDLDSVRDAVKSHFGVDLADQ